MAAARLGRKRIAAATVPKQESPGAFLKPLDHGIHTHAVLLGMHTTGSCSQTLSQVSNFPIEDWNLVLIASLPDHAAGSVATTAAELHRSVIAAGAWVLQQGSVSPHCADFDFEFPRSLCFDIYASLVLSGIQLSAEAHSQLTGLCHCTLQLCEWDRRQVARIHLSIYAGEGAEAFLGDLRATHNQAA